jgi:hypothetical protein
MLSRNQNILIHKSAAAWNLSRADYVECLMESTGVASTKQFRNQGQFERAMAALEKRAEILGTWWANQNRIPGYWQKNLAMKGGGKTTDGEALASSAQLHEIQNLKYNLAQVHPRLKDDPRAQDRYITTVLEAVTQGRAILLSAITSGEAQRLIAALRRSYDNWARKLTPSKPEPADYPF